MKASFWHQRWEKGETAFHERDGNALLIKHFDKLQLAVGSRVFLPLCGKTRDFAWLLAKGYRVVGVELSKIAIVDLFDALGLEPTTSKMGELTRFRGENIDVFVGDMFALSTDMLGPVDAIFDRAALVALPKDMRDKYADHLVGITNAAKQMLITFEYDQKQMDGPPFSIDEATVRHHYGAVYKLEHVETQIVEGRLKKKVDATETVWLMRQDSE